jgi:serine-type D-Ala-D-Ala carboxypeptidase (penicillin-binding protein 5/6)
MSIVTPFRNQHPATIGPAHGMPGRRSHRRTVVIALVALLAVALGAVVGVVAVRTVRDDSRRHYLAADGWPAQGQAALAIGTDSIAGSPAQRQVPIASVAKVMTAFLVLKAAPLNDGQDGFRLTVTAADVRDTELRRHNDESVVQVATGEVLTERQALIALLLPSANNVAVMIARRVAGSIAAFVARMNQAARSLGMTDTVYTDPSGLDEGTQSTAADQLRLAQVAMDEPGFAALVATPAYRLPVAGVVHNTDTLLGKKGFVGIKTGSDDAAGGCFMFRTRRLVGTQLLDVTGVVLGQPGHNLIDAGLAAASQLADRVAPIRY